MGLRQGMPTLGKDGRADNGGNVVVVSVVWCESVHVLFQSVCGYMQVACVYVVCVWGGGGMLIQTVSHLKDMFIFIWIYMSEYIPIWRGWEETNTQSRSAPAVPPTEPREH